LSQLNSIKTILLSTMSSKTAPSSTLSARVYEVLKNKIISGELAQGAKLTEEALSKEFQISRGPLREALRSLESVRLITRIPHAGIRVVTLTTKLMQDIYTVREALEGMSARMAATKMSDKEIAELNELLNDHAKDIERKQGKVYFQYEGDLDFHYKIAAACSNEWLEDILSNELYQLLRMCRHRSGQIPNRPSKALNEHRQIAAAIENRDPELAEMLMRRHISGAWLQVRDFLISDEQAESNPAVVSKVAQ
jgi:DNA-binding GntR family transcriptional regulator